MKYFAILLFVLGLALPVHAASRDLIRMTPANSFFVLAADVADLRQNEVFSNLAQNGEIWVFDEGTHMEGILKTLHIDAKKDLSSFLFTRYLNPYGNKGKFHLLELTRDITPELEKRESTPYLGVKLYRLEPQGDLYVASLGANTFVLGAFTGVKMAVDVSHGKTEALEKNTELKTLFGKVPRQAAFWGMSLPFSRDQAARQGSEQSTNAMLQAFQNYYFYGIPAAKNVNSHFIGRAKSESEATFVRTFMIGTLTFAKFKVEDNVAEMLDTVDVQREGLDIHVSGTVTKEIMDSYFNGELGVN